jgi:hypothetical protein
VKRRKTQSAKGRQRVGKVIGVGQLGIVAKPAVGARFPFPPPVSRHAPDVGGAEGIEAVHEGDADVDFRRLSFRVL